MLGVTDYGAFVVAFVLLLVLPGPGNLALITSTGKGGIRGGIASVFGIIFGDQVLLWLAVAGVAALLQANPVVFKAAQWAGASYLVWLGGRMLLAKPDAAPILDLQPSHYLRQTFAITLLNPKAILFYMAFFPLFIDPARHLGAITFAFMGVTVAVLTFCYGLALVLLTHCLAERLRANRAAARGLEKLAGFFLVGFGFKLLSSR